MRCDEPRRRALIRQAFRLEYATLAWMAIEAAVAIWSAALANSIALLAFGIDSLIERASGSRALRADAVESIACGWLALVVVAGLAVKALTGAWWVDAVASLGIAWLLVREGREALRGEDCCQT